MKRHKRTKIRPCDWIEVIMWLLILAGCVGVTMLGGCDNAAVNPSEPDNSPCCPGGECRTDVLVVHFTAEWCGPCQKQKPRVDALRRQGITVRTIDIDKNSGSKEAYGIESIPTYLVWAGKHPDWKEVLRTQDITEVEEILRR